MIDWAKHQTQKFSVFSDITISRSTPIPFARSFSLSLSPSLIPSTGPLIRALVNSGVSRYGQFKLLDAVLICKAKPGIDVATLTSLSNDSSSLHTHPKASESSEAVSSSNMHETFFTSFSASQFLRRVPATKEDIFRTRSIPLISKRKLMRFLQFAASEFEMKPELQGLSEVQLSFGEFLKTKFGLDDEMTDAILFALAFCVKPDGEYSYPSYVIIFNHTHRPNCSCLDPPQRIHSVCRTLWKFTVSGRSLWWAGRVGTRLLSVCYFLIPCSAWSFIMWLIGHVL